MEAERASIRMSVAMHGGQSSLPTVEERIADFDAALLAEPKAPGPLDELHRLLGVA